MRKFFLLLMLCLSIPCLAQKTASPYRTDFWKDGAWIAGGVGLTATGVLIIQNKDGLTEAEVNNLDKKDIWKVDRWSAGYYSDRADKISYIPFYASFALPVAFLPSEEERSNFGQITVLYLEAMSTTGALFTLTAGLVNKSRPLVYDSDLPLEKRAEPGAQRAFFAGHTAATAAATFFAAKIFNDYHPNSKAKPWIWAGAAAIPAYVGYLRLKAGKHFLTDNIIGYAVGAAAGILIPEVHKKGNENIDIYPTASYNMHGMGINTEGIAISYTF